MIINTNKQLNDVIATLRNTSQLAIDTEFYWMRTYYPELCLLQIATENEIFLIDTLKELDFSKLKDIFAAKDIQKIIHSATNDIPIIKRFFNCEVNNIFDTQLAAAFLGFQTQSSLKTLLKEILDIEMEKESQFSDWRNRPLSQKQLDYAIKDVKYLIQLKEFLQQQLAKSQYQDFFEQELVEIQKAQFNSIESIYNKIGNIQKFDEKTQKNAILIAQWREMIAQEKNIPVRFIFNNKILYIIAHTNPKSLNSFDHDELKRLKPWIKKGVITALSSTKSLDQVILEQKSGSKLAAELNDKIVAFFDIQAKQFKFDSSIIASRKDIRSLAYNLSIDTNYTNNKLLAGWRYKIVGKKLKEYILDSIK
ncbi:MULTISPECIES: ribonuclease D [Francisella]|uniref:Ribonuclease D n=1 Tax=Francisella opportunistica TaxID=2016517 RepID=A0A345JTR1_9GAMM|nr:MULTISPECIES: ribonuclease D [Francisella]AXH30707.1 ribonuclease D [Francisella opportunistica]AXH32351.1 ribonuclease D [Francisella opportunistica]AXH33997.1 ribonuclease D [Francisella opportunistica]